jgi:hypothetical protein
MLPRISFALQEVFSGWCLSILFITNIYLIRICSFFNRYSSGFVIKHNYY